MKRCKHKKPCRAHMLKASIELNQILRRYGSALDEVSHRDLAKVARTLEHRANWLKSSHPAGPPPEYGDDDLGIHVGGG
jgi:hypothetical protein